MIVVADTGPLNYLVLIQMADLLLRLFEEVLIPPAVLAELKDPSTPPAVRKWISRPPVWLQVRTLSSLPETRLAYLGDGEREAITLAAEVAASHLLMDDMDARKEAARRQLRVIGTLGVLRKAAQLDLIHLPSALALLQQTNFYVAPDLIQWLLDEDARRTR